jgi:hypothetical protein
VKSELWIESLTVENLGPLSGQRRFEFGREPEEPWTCILGPNGSGKTYLVNSICWVFDLPGTLMSVRGDLAVNNAGEYFLVEAGFEFNGANCSVTRLSNRPQDFVPPQASVNYFDMERFPSSLADEFYGDGGHGSGALLVFALSRFLDDLAKHGDFRPIVFDAVLGRLDMRQSMEAVALLASHPAQMIFFGTKYDCAALLEHGRATKVLEI